MFEVQGVTQVQVGSINLSLWWWCLFGHMIFMLQSPVRPD